PGAACSTSHRVSSAWFSRWSCSQATPWLSWAACGSAASLIGLASNASAEALVRVDQILLAGGLAVVGGGDLRVEGLRQADLGGVVAGEGGLQLVGHPLAQLLHLRRRRLREEIGQQPAAEAPGHAEAAH